MARCFFRSADEIGFQDVGDNILRSIVSYHITRLTPDKRRYRPCEVWLEMYGRLISRCVWSVIALGGHRSRSDPDGMEPKGVLP